MQAPVVQRVVQRPVVQAPVVQGVIRRPVMLIARSGQRDSRCAWCRSRPVMQGVLPDARGSDRTPVVGRGTMQVWSADAAGNPKEGDRSAEHGIAVDRCAPEIVGFLKASPSALAATECHTVRHPWKRDCHSFLIDCDESRLFEGPLCQLRHASARCAGVVRTLVMLIARCAACSTKARGAASTLWAA